MYMSKIPIELSIESVDKKKITILRCICVFNVYL